jgi:hypothetical protein
MVFFKHHSPDAHCAHVKFYSKLFLFQLLIKTTLLCDKRGVLFTFTFSQNSYFFIVVVIVVDKKALIQAFRFPCNLRL